MANEKKYLDPKEAIRLMLDGETLVDEDGDERYWNEGEEAFYCRIYDGLDVSDEVFTSFGKLRRKPAPGAKKRLMTRESTVSKFEVEE
jgi:hypothetical protein